MTRTDNKPCNSDRICIKNWNCFVNNPERKPIGVSASPYLWILSQTSGFLVGRVSG